MAEVHPLEERVTEVEEGLEALRMARACIEELTAERTSLAAGSEQSEVECSTLAPRTCEWNAAGATHDREIGGAVLAKWSLEGRKAVCK